MRFDLQDCGCDPRQDFFRTDSFAPRANFTAEGVALRCGSFGAHECGGTESDRWAIAR